MIIWIIGLHASGKTSLARALKQRLEIAGGNWLTLDGDDLREVWSDQLGHDLDSRRLNHLRISKLSALLDRQGFHAIASVLSIFPELRRWNRENISNYFEVFLDVPMDVLLQRDPKGLYKNALLGEAENVVGVDLTFPQPDTADLILSPPHSLQPPPTMADFVTSALPNIR